MRLNRKFLGVLLTVLLAAMTIAIPVTPVAAANVSVICTPSSGPPGTYLTVNESGCTPNSSYTVFFGNNAITSGTVPSTGLFTAYFTIPAWARGSYNVTISTNASPADTTATPSVFQITPTIHLNVATGGTGDQISFTGNGFTALAPISVYFEGTAVTMVSPVTTDYNGTFTTGTFVVPALAGGNHIITAADNTGATPGVNFQITPKMTLSASTVAVGGSITATGNGFAPSSPLSFFLDGNAITTNMHTDTTGNFTNVGITIPAVAGGSHTLIASDNSGNSLSAPLTVTGGIGIAPTSGTVDTIVVVTGKGFLATSTIIFTYDGATVTTTPTAVTSDANGSFSGSFKVPAGSSGSHVIKASDGTNSNTLNFSTSASASVTPTSGPVGTAVAAKGSGFKGNGTVTITYNGAQIATATSNGLGNFSATINIPPSSTGPHNLVVSDSSNSQPFVFTITATPKDPSPVSGPIGTSVSASGSGFAANKALSVTFDSAPLTLTPVSTTDANGTFNVSFKIPTSKSGNHTIVITDGTTSNNYTFKIDATAPAAPVLSTPAAATKLGKVPTLSWGAVTSTNGGITYTLQISKDQNFNTLLIQKTGLTTPSYTLDTNVPAEKLKSASKSAPYYWRVQATDAASNVSAWTTPQTFLVGLAIGDYIIYIVFAVIALMLGALGFVLGRITKRAI